eukprot:3388671-Pleurochrysis_carterae.AAC.2
MSTKRYAGTHQRVSCIATAGFVITAIKSVNHKRMRPTTANKASPAPRVARILAAASTPQQAGYFRESLDAI